MERGKTAESKSDVDRRTVLVTAAAVAVAGPALAVGRGPFAMTRAGQIRGAEREGIKIFRGVPYGADTGGANRWLPPKPVAKWTGIRDCLEYGPAPPQSLPIVAPMKEETDMLQQGPVGEDCLTLNVYTPAIGPNSGKRAVMLWFHGGGFVAGSGNATSYDGVNLARKQDVVLVSVTHRLNHFGFLHLADLYGDAYADSGNVGMLDAVAALRWVHDNIAMFGGDPGRVMAFGQSGGASKVFALMGMPAAKGLFHRGAAQSGAAHTLPRPVAGAAAKRLIDALGVNSLAELQATPWRKIVETAAANRGSGGGVPVLGPSLPAPFDPTGSALSWKVPLIFSTVETENTFFGPPLTPLDDAQLTTAISGATRLADADAAELIGTFKAAYPGKDNLYLAQLIISQWTINDAVVTLAEKKAAQAAATGGAPDYFFYFAHHTDVRGGVLHAPHTSEIPYVFDSLAHSAPIVGTVTPAKQKLADMCSAYWANFARTGNPNGPNLPEWSTFTAANRAMLVVTDQGATTVADPLKATRGAVAAAKAKLPLGSAVGRLGADEACRRAAYPFVCLYRSIGKSPMLRVDTMLHLDNLIR